MGLEGFYLWLRKKRGYNPTLRNPMHYHLPDDPLPTMPTIRVDVLSFYKIREIYTKRADNKQLVHSILLEYIKKYGNPLHMLMAFYVDGAPASEKRETHLKRNEKQVKGLKNAKIAIETLSNRASQGKPLTKQMFKNVDNSLRGGCNRKLDACLCRTEADIVIAADCQPEDTVLSQDSDFFAYDSVSTIWRPVGKRDEVKVLEYKRAAVLAQIGLSTTKLTALACVSRNDYNKNIPSMGLATNYSIIKDLSDADVPSLVEEYLESPRVICGSQEGIDFTASILVFTTMTQEIAVSADVSSALSPSSQSATPLTASPASSLSYELLCQQYKVVKDRHARVKEQKRQENLSIKSNAKPDRQGKHKEFRRYRVIDRPARQPGVSRQVHRPRYSYKARPEAQQHEQPSICKQYQWKPYTAKQEARYRESEAESKGKEAKKKRQRETRRLQKEKELAKKPPLKIDEMNTIKRAAAAATTNSSQLHSSEQQQQQVAACILEVVKQVRVTKRHVQEFLGAFIETVGLTGEDRTILSFLCPAVESKIRVAPQLNQDSQATSSSIASTSTKSDSEEGEKDAEDGVDNDTEDAGDEDTEPSAMDKPFIAFYQIVLAHIYSRKIKPKTVIERQVDQLLSRVTTLGITLPLVPPAPSPTQPESCSSRPPNRSIAQ
ncbi:hypothetical protein BGZ47_006358 [Haplosporangium gracile]|nr:hypothetical protein BGZ47_006358 [Haplosporangium gracile]